MHPISQIISRNIERRGKTRNALWVNPAKDHCWQSVQTGCDTLTLFSQDFGTYAFMDKCGAVCRFSAFPEATGGRYDWIILNQPRQKALLGMLLDAVKGLLSDDGVLWLAGENRAGIKSAAKLLKPRFERVTKLDSARHCTLFEVSKAKDGLAFDADRYRDKWLLEFGARELRVVSYPGVFAHGRLDAGTSLLLQALAEYPLNGQVLDFACGAGIVGLFIASHYPDAQLTVLDSSALALQSSTETFAANQQEVKSVASDGLSEITEKYDFIVSNPPIHSGVKTDNQLGIRLLASAGQHLKPGGSLIIVANIHLPYEKMLASSYTRQQQLAANDHYKVLAARI